MTDIVNTGAPKLTIKKHTRARVSCPNCDSTLDLNAEEVDIGQIVKCDDCKKNTYYPFERPWYKKGKLIAGYISSMLVAFFIGLAVNSTSDLLKSGAHSTSAKSTTKG